jgi:hypothetical protein
MTQIDNVITKLFGVGKKEVTDVYSPDFPKFAIEQAPNVIGKYFEYDSDKAIREFLFENSDIGKELKKIMDKIERLKAGDTDVNFDDIDTKGLV